MRFLLPTTLNPNLVKFWVCQETSPVGSLLPPVDLASVAAVLKKAGHDVKILDLRLYKNRSIRYKREIGIFKPDAIIINITTTSADDDYKIISETPAEITKICFGNHANAMKSECFEKGADFILLGDPEQGIINWLNGDSGKMSVPGVLGKKDAITGKGQVFVDDLDTLPFPALDLLELDKYHAPYFTKGKRFTIILGSRGCPFQCSFCLYPVLFGKRIRMRSVENIVAELTENKDKNKIRQFYFVDATFNSSIKRVEDFCNLIIEKKLDISWSCNMRVVPVNKKILELMHKAGCKRIFYGIEDIELVDKIQKKISFQDVKTAFQLTKEANINTVAFLMLFPREDITEKEYKKRVMKLIKEIKPDAVQCTIAIPFPGTKMYEDFEASDLLHKGWSKYDPSGSVLPYKSPLNLVKLKMHIYLDVIKRNPKMVWEIISGQNIKGLFLLSQSLLRIFKGISRGQKKLN